MHAWSCGLDIPVQQLVLERFELSITSAFAKGTRTGIVINSGSRAVPWRPGEFMFKVYRHRAHSNSERFAEHTVDIIATPYMQVRLLSKIMTLSDLLNMWISPIYD